MSDQTANAGSAPALELIFNGLFFLCFNTGGQPAVADPAGECRVGFITTVPQHQITISGKQTTPPDDDGVNEPFEITLTHAEARKIQIDLNVPGVVSPSVTRKGHDQPIDRGNPTTSVGDYFKWIIGLENFEMHNTKLPLMPHVLKPVMHINIGEFYTKELSRVKYFRTQVGADNEDFGSVAAVTGVRIATLPEGKAFLKIGGEIRELVAQPGVTYEVTFANLCPRCEEHQLGDLHLSDFPAHYHAFDVNVLGQFDFDFEGEPSFPPAVCYAASGSQTTDI